MLEHDFHVVSEKLHIFCSLKFFTLQDVTDSGCDANAAHTAQLSDPLHLLLSLGLLLSKFLLSRIPCGPSSEKNMIMSGSGSTHGTLLRILR